MAQEDIGTLVVKIETDLKKFNKGLKSAGSSIGKFSKSVLKVGAAITGAMLGAGIAVFGFATKAAGAADRVDKLSQKIGISRQAFQEWDFILSQAGTSVEGLQMGVKTLSKAAFEASQGVATYKDSFDELGITVTDVNGDLKSQEDLLNETIAALIAMDDETKRTALASELLGRSATELAPLLNGGTEALENMRTQANELGLILKDETIDAGVVFTDTMDQLKRTLSAVLTESLGPLLPTINDLAQELIKILPPLLGFIQPLIQKLLPVVDRLITALLPVFLKLLDAFMPILDPVIDLFLLLIDKALIPMLESMVPIIETIMPVFIDFLNILIEVLTPLFDKLSQLGPILGIVGAGLLLLISPIGLIGAAIIALIAGITLLIKNWETVSEFFVKIWTDISNFFTSISEKIVSTAKSIWKGFIDFFIVTIPEAFNKFIGFIASLPEKVFTFIKDLFIEKIPFAVGFAIGFMIQTVKEGIPKLLKFFAELPSKIGAFLVETINRIIEWGKRIKENASETGKNFIDGIINFVKKLPSEIGKWISNVISEIISLVPKVIKAAKSIGKGILDGIVDFIKTLPSKILSVLTDALNVIKNIGKKIGSFISGIFKGAGKGISAGTASAIQTPNTPGLAHGGEITRAGRVLVGERGKEEVLLPRGAQVRPLGGIDENKIGQAVAKALMPMLSRQSIIVMDGQKVAKTLWLPLVREKDRLGVGTL